MRFEGRMWKDGRYWLVEVPLLDVMSQGRSRKDALHMIADAIESLVERPGFKVEVVAAEGNTFEVGSADAATLVAFFLRRQREAHGLSLADVSARMGQSSRNAYARYEQGKAIPTVEKLDELLRAIGQSFVLSESKA